MACGFQAIMLQLSLSTVENGSAETSCLVIKNSNLVLNWKDKPSSGRPTSMIGTKLASFPRKRYIYQTRRHGWNICFALDTGGIPPSNGGQDSVNGDSPGLGRTRLGRLVSAGGKQLLEKLNSARKNFPMKVFLLLLGFYTANALATILGQTGDWDVLVAGVVVAAIEGIGMLMYRRTTPSVSTGRFQSLVVMINYWKAGVCLGLFVDAFKLGS